MLIVIAAIAAVVFCSFTACERRSYIAHRYSVKARHASQHRDYSA